MAMSTMFALRSAWRFSSAPTAVQVVEIASQRRLGRPADLLAQIGESHRALVQRPENQSVERPGKQ